MVFKYFFPAPKIENKWMATFKCPKGRVKTAWNAKKNWDLQKAKDECKKACDNRSDCLFSDLYFTSKSSRSTCYLRGIQCGNWRQNRHGSYHLYKKGTYMITLKYYPS